MIIRKVRELTGLPIHYFVSLKMDGFVNVIDILGGVEIDVPNINNRGGMFYNDPTPGGARINIPTGRQTLNGQDALGFVRFRTYPDGDLGRIRAQQEFITALVEQHLNIGTLTNINRIFVQMYENVRTNFVAVDLLNYAILLRGIDPENIQTFQLPGGGGYVGAISYFIPNLRQIETLINEEFLLRVPEISDGEYEEYGENLPEQT